MVAVLTAKGARVVEHDGAPEGALVRFDILDPEGNIVQISQE